MLESHSELLVGGMYFVERTWFKPLSDFVLCGGCRVLTPWALAYLLVFVVFIDSVKSLVKLKVCLEDLQGLFHSEFFSLQENMPQWEERAPP